MENTPANSKVFNDPIHGHIVLHPLLVKIIDTPQFQRLRNIKQLGGTYFVYPGASHNRFEHSLGVAYIAGQLLKNLKEKQPELAITDKDILCVQIAGLCHDLGHGPFSHLFENKFLPRARPGNYPKHETLSVKMFDYLLKENKLLDELKKHKVDKEMKFIEEMITRPDKSGTEWTLKGRPKKKAFLYEVVNNSDNGVDVDKFDYLARDCYYLGITNNFDYRRFLHFAQVCEVDGKKTICTRDKMYNNMYNLFYTRLCLHQKACQHTVTNAVEEMIVDAFLEADGKRLYEGAEEPKVCLAAAVDDMEKYSKLTDQVFEQILNSTSEELKKAREMLNDVLRRKLYKMVGEKPLEKIPQDTEGLKEALKKSDPDNDFFENVIDFNFGKKDKNPLNNFYFYSKQQPHKARLIQQDEVPMMFPKLFSKRVMRWYSKKNDPASIESAMRHFNEWYQSLLSQNTNFSGGQEKRSSSG